MREDASVGATVQRLQSGASFEETVAAVLDALHADGVVIVEGLIAPSVVDTVNGEVEAYLSAADPQMRHLNPALDGFHGPCTKHVSGLAGKSRTFATEIMVHPVLSGACDAILGPSCARWQLNLAHLLARGPGADDQWLHRDELVWNLVPEPHPELQVASIVALVDFTADIGATRIVPGSHRWDHARQPEPDEIVVAEMPAGSAVIYLGSTIHGGGANKSADVWRRGVHLSYTLGWLRTEENNYLAVPPEIAATLPPECQDALGYAVHDAIHLAGGYLGMVDLRDPVELLASGELG